LSVTADAQSKVKGAVDPTLTYTHGTLQNGDTDSVFNGGLTRDPGETVGQYAINRGELSAGPDYTIAYEGNFLTITQPKAHLTNVFLSVDPLGRPIISVANQAIVHDAPFEPVETLTVNTDVSVKFNPGHSGQGNSANALANIAPAAGGDNPGNLANIEPAAGGTGVTKGNDVDCANNFLDNKACETKY
jgi:hypothetical protein